MRQAIEIAVYMLLGFCLVQLYGYWKRDKKRREQRRELRQQFEEHLARELARELNAWRERRTQDLRPLTREPSEPWRPN